MNNNHKKSILKNQNGIIIQKCIEELFNKKIPAEKMIQELGDSLSLDFDFEYDSCSIVSLDVSTSIDCNICIMRKVPISENTSPKTIDEISRRNAFFEELNSRLFREMDEYISHYQIKKQLEYSFIPKHIVNKIFWAPSTKNDIKANYKYKIIIEYSDGRVIGYSNILSPVKYLKIIETKILESSFTDIIPHNRESHIKYLKDNILKVFLKKEEEDSSFFKVWDINSHCFITEDVEEFENNRYVYEDYNFISYDDEEDNQDDSNTDYEYDEYQDNNSYTEDPKELERDTFYALTDGQYGSYEEFYGIEDESY